MSQSSITLPEVPYGCCHCCCGGLAPICTHTWLARGRIKGEPLKFISGHNGVQPRVDFSDAAPFKINGVYCKLLSLTKGMFTIIWESDYDKYSRYRWAPLASGDSFYVSRCEYDKEGNRRTILLHRQLLGLEYVPANIVEVDHKSGVGLDNRRDNLRPADRVQQMRYTKKSKRNTSGRKGVHEVTMNGKIKYRARGTDDSGKRVHLGYFDTIEEAYAAYCEFALRVYGEFAKLK